MRRTRQAWRESLEAVSNASQGGPPLLNRQAVVLLQVNHDGAQFGSFSWRQRAPQAAHALERGLIGVAGIAAIPPFAAQHFHSGLDTLARIAGTRVFTFEYETFLAHSASRTRGDKQT